MPELTPADGDLWQKQCTKGKYIFEVEAKTYNEAREKFLKFFYPRSRDRGDRLLQYCRMCNNGIVSGHFTSCTEKIQMFNKQNGRDIISGEPLDLISCHVDHGPGRKALVTGRVNMMIGNGNIEEHTKILQYLRGEL